MMPTSRFEGRHRRSYVHDRSLSLTAAGHPTADPPPGHQRGNARVEARRRLPLYGRCLSAPSVVAYGTEARPHPTPRRFSLTVSFASFFRRNGTAEELDHAELDFSDPVYEVTIANKAVKCSAN